MKNLTSYQISKLQVMSNLKIRVRGHVVGLHTDNFVETYATIYRHPRYGSCHEMTFAVLHQGTLHENAVLWPMSNHPVWGVEGDAWFVIEGDRLAICRNDN